jgi:hypothetical protein
VGTTLAPEGLPGSIGTEPPSALVARLAGRGLCLTLIGDQLHLVDLRPVADPPRQPDVVAAVRARKADLVAFLRAADRPDPAVTAVGDVADLVAAVGGASRVGVEFTTTGSACPYRARVTRLVLAPDPATALVLPHPQAADLRPLRDALARTQIAGWGSDCTRLGLLALLLVGSDREVAGVVPGAGLVGGDDADVIALAARRAAAAQSIAAIPQPTTASPR